MLDWSLRAAWTTRVVLLTLLLLALGPKRSQAKSGTTPNIREIFIGRCWGYQHVVNPSVFQSNPKNCSLLWQHFKEAFANRNPCDVPMGRYDKFATYADHEVPNDKILFWSGVFPFVYRYTSLGKRYVAIGDTLSGYIVANLHWCGQEGEPGISYDQCPEWNECNDTAEGTFWKTVSVHFASNARGQAYLMLNASKEEAFRKDSTFGSHELPHLNSSRVKSLHVFLVRPVSHKGSFSETCDKGSVVSLRRLVEARGITFNCTENPYDVLHVLCAGEHTSTRCREVSRAVGLEMNSAPDHRVMSVGLHLAFCIYLLHFLGFWEY